MERTLTILKPDSVSAGKAGAILAHLEKEGFRILGMRKTRLATEQARAFYAVHKERPFYDALVKFMTEGPVVVAALEREDAVPHLRRTMGATDSRKAEPGTIRGDYGVSNSFNLIHGSDSPESAARELGLFFKADELLDWTPAGQVWVYDMSKGQPE